MEDNNQIVKSKKKSYKKVLIALLIVIVFVFSNIAFFLAGNSLALSGIRFRNSSSEAMGDLNEINDVQKYQLLFQVRDTLLAQYDGEIDDNQLLESAIKGMTSSLNDPYTVFMNKDEYKSFVEQSEGHFVGIGAQLGIKENKPTVVAPIEGSPSEASGLKSGDVILKVDDKDVSGLSLDAIVGMVRGEQGVSVKMTVLRNEKDTIDINIVRDVIKVVTVKGEIIDGNIGYIQIASFDEDVAKDFKAKIVELKSQGMKGMILDLRGNPGGFLNEAVEVSSQFIGKGKIVTYTIDKYGKKNESKSVGGEAEGMPLTILIDGGSASASEVVTGALRDYEAGTIIGTKSFGKGIVQQLIQLNDGEAGLKVTTSKYYTPNGENIHKIGIIPNVEVTISDEILKKEYDRNIDPQYLKALEVIKDKLK
ncbi:S41 family peptidase [Clostridium sp.]|uniref:S41 family peptidase n=1 Tax=Clostridium sp. TaxID=1506 RepID=UPI00262EF557|nr:S41 family peptidase [Clostridium sp.]